MSRLRLLMTADTIGGVWTYSIELARALRQHADIVLAAMGAAATMEQREQAQAAGVRFYNHPFRLEWMEEPWDDVRAAGTWLLDLEQRFKPDLIHLNNFAHAALPWHSPVVVVGHSCVCSWWEAVHGEPAPASWNHYRDRVRAGLAAADAVVAPTGAMLHALERHYGPFRDSRVVHNGLEARWRPAEQKEPFILCAGRLWDQGKNVALLAEAAPGLTWPVRVAGDARSPDGYETEITNVTFLGRLSRDQLARQMQRSALYALPARYEPFGLSVLEAASHGCALVLGDIGSLRELWQDAALFVSPDDPDALRQTLARLIGDADLRQHWGGRALSRAAAYPAASMTAAYLDLYDELCCSAAIERNG